MDLLPTLATLAGADIGKLQIDGLDFSPLLLGKSEVSPRTGFFYYDAGRLAAVRDLKWKLHLHGPEGESRMLFDLENDPGESKDVFAAHSSIVAKLTAEAAEAVHLLGNGNQKGVLERPEGKVSRLQPISRALPMVRNNDEPELPPEAGKAVALPEAAALETQPQIP